MRQAKYLVVIEKGETSYGGIVPDCPGVFGVGDTVEEVLEEVKGALELWLAYAVERGEEVPEGTFTGCEFVEVDVPEKAAEASDFIIEPDQQAS